MLEESVVAVRARKVEYLILVRRADESNNLSHCLGALHRAIHEQTLKGLRPQRGCSIKPEGNRVALSLEMRSPSE
jgi:hypothetical protein